MTLDKKYCAFPGIMNGGIISAIFDCHGNWTAAVALMDKGCLPKPPLTLTYEMLVRLGAGGRAAVQQGCWLRLPAITVWGLFRGGGLLLLLLLLLTYEMLVGGLGAGCLQGCCCCSHRCPGRALPGPLLPAVAGRGASNARRGWRLLARAMRGSRLSWQGMLQRVPTPNCLCVSLPACLPAGPSGPGPRSPTPPLPIRPPHPPSAANRGSFEEPTLSTPPCTHPRPGPSPNPPHPHR